MWKVRCRSRGGDIRPSFSRTPRSQARCLPRPDRRGASPPRRCLKYHLRRRARAHAEAPLGDARRPRPVDRAEGRIGATVNNNIEDRHLRGRLLRQEGQSRYNPSDPNQSSIVITSGSSQVQPWLTASVAE